MPDTPTTPGSPRIPTEFLSPGEAAAFLGVSIGTLTAWRRKGTGPAFIRVSERRIVYSIDALRSYVAARVNIPCHTPPEVVEAAKRAREARKEQGSTNSAA